MTSFQNLADLLQKRSQSLGDTVLYHFHDDHGDIKSLTYRQLYEKSTALAQHLAKQFKPGDRAILIYPPGLDLIIGFFACLFAGLIAVPVYPPVTAGLVEKLRNIMLDCHPAAVLTTQEIAQKMLPLRVMRLLVKIPGAKFLLHRFAAQTFALAQWPIESVKLILSDQFQTQSAVNVSQLPQISANDIAFLQYTSGSTGNPKGVMVSHGNLLSNLEIIYQCFEIKPGEIGASWLPPYHDMGLIGGILEPMYGQMTAHLFSPMNFLRRPYRWLKMISDYRINVTGGPNFAYEMCIKHISEAQRKTLDLSCWRVAFNGAEPIKAETLQRFTKAFESCGFSNNTHYPCYGLAESTLLVTGVKAGTGFQSYFSKQELSQKDSVKSRAEEAQKCLVSSGKPYFDVQIVDPETGESLPDEVLGEIWVHGGSVAHGYWNDAYKSQETFHAKLRRNPQSKEYLRTGDLGFLYQNELYITGRMKDLIIIRGRNYYPQDIEHVIEQSHSAIRPGCVAAFALNLDQGEGIGVVCELNANVSDAEYEQIFNAMNKEVATQQQAKLHRIILIPTKNIPKTTSGKLRRFLCREMLLNKKFPVLAQWSIKND
jgi:acyl-CoA synthetase (AMP-forming)/AMP-acid ligase II